MRLPLPLNFYPFDADKALSIARASSIGKNVTEEYYLLMSDSQQIEDLLKNNPY